MKIEWVIVNNFKNLLSIYLNKNTVFPIEAIFFFTLRIIHKVKCFGYSCPFSEVSKYVLLDKLSVIVWL